MNVNKIKTKLQTRISNLSQAKKEKLEEKTNLDLRERQTLMEKNAIESLSNEGLGNQKIYQDLKNWDNLKLWRRIFYIHIFKKMLS